MDNDLVNRCKAKLDVFRLKELKDVLGRVGVSKQGRKQDLVDRILALLYDEGTPGVIKNNVNGKEGVAEIIDDTYRLMHVGGATSHSADNKAQLEEQAGESFDVNRKIRCPCGSNLPTGHLVQCVDPNCNVWKHASCVLEEPVESIPVSVQFFCELCRLKRADPYWSTVAHPLFPVKLTVSSVPADGTSPVQRVERTFKLTRADRDLLQKAEYEVQAWCMLLNDSVPFRMQWLLHADLQVNGIPIRTFNRPGSQLLGTNGRDDGAKVTPATREGINTISLSGSDARSFCFGVRLVKRRTFQQVLNMIPKETDGEPFEDALSRVQRCIGGGIATGNDDSDSDLEVIANSVTVNLRCPMSGSRMKRAGRFKPCAHMGCFDLETLVSLNERSRKWQCPICLKNYSLEDVIIDPFFNPIVTMMQSCGEEINDVEMNPDGSWRVKTPREFRDLALWHYPDGSSEIFTTESAKLIDRENSSGENNSSNLLMQNRTVNGVAGTVCNTLEDEPLDELEDFDQKVITMSSTATEDDKDGEDCSINQDGGEQLSMSNGNGYEISSAPCKFGPAHGLVNQSYSAPAKHGDIIIVSDSEEDDVSLVYPEVGFTDVPSSIAGHSQSAPPKALNSYSVNDSLEDASVFFESDQALMMPQLPPSSQSQATATFDYFSVDINALDTGLPTSSCMVASEHVPDSSLCQDHDSCTDGLDGGQFRGVDDNYPQPDFLPCQSANQQPVLSSNVEADTKPVDTNELDSAIQSSSKEDSFLPSISGESGSDLNVNGKRSDGHPSFTRKPRSLRPTKKRCNV